MDMRIPRVPDFLEIGLPGQSHPPRRHAGIQAAERISPPSPAKRTVFYSNRQQRLPNLEAAPRGSILFLKQ
jgi:hypothetical protein